MRQIAEDYLAVRAAAVVTDPAAVPAGDALAALPATAAFAEGLDGTIATLEARRKTLSDTKEAYTAADTDLTIDAIRRSGEQVVVEATELTRLTYARIMGDEPPFTAYEIEHTLTFERGAQGSLVLASDAVPENGGPLPTTYVASR